MTPTIFAEFPPMAHGMIGLITIGQMNKVGTCFGMALDPARPMSDMPSFVNDDWDSQRPGYWADYHGRRIAAMCKSAGFAAVDMSGWCFGREILAMQVIPPAADASGWSFTIEALRQTLAAAKIHGAEINKNWLFWSNSEGGADGDRLTMFRRLWDSRITGNAQLLVTNMVGGTSVRRPYRFPTFRAIDNHTSEVPGWFGGPWGQTDQECLDFTAEIIDDVQSCGMEPVLHSCGVGYDGSGAATSVDRTKSQVEMYEMARKMGVNKFLVFNCGGRIKPNVVIQQLTDADTVAAINQ